MPDRHPRLTPTSDLGRAIRGTGPPATHYELPTVTVFEFDGQGMILRMEVFQDGWAFVCQGADQSSGLSGLLARSFTSRIDSERKKGMPL